MMWKIIGASAIGESHSAHHQPCQDHHFYSNAGGLLVAIACDGAGSATNGKQGAKFGSESITTELMSALEGKFEDANFSQNSFRSLLEQIIEGVRTKLLNEQIACSQDLSAFHSTLVGLVFGSNGGYFFHIGDGAGVAFESNRSTIAAFSRAENGDFADQTFFYTMDNWREHLRITVIPKSAEVFLLMSDGTMPFCLNSSQDGIEPRFFRPLDEYLLGAEITSESGSQALMETLSSERANSISKDDKTLVWISKQIETVITNEC
jgi:hypothetical protein